jgi:hypothetical protein
MKIKLVCVLISYALNFSLVLNAQEAYGGTRKNLQTNTLDAVFFTCSTYTSQTVFYNHYSIFQKLGASKTDTIYTVDINFDRLNNSIIISQLDKISNQSYSKTITFHPLSYTIIKTDAKPIYCIKNYIFNDTLLSVTTDNNSDILFTIADTINPLIFLHQIVSVDGKYRFDLDKFRKSYLIPHLAHARDYWQWYKLDSLNRARDLAFNEQKKAIQAEIDKEISMIKSDMDSLMVILNEKKKAIKLSDTIADERLQELFAKRVDKIFADYFSETRSLNTVIIGSYKLYVNADQPIRIIKKQTPEVVNNWVAERLDSIYNVIKYLPLENEKASGCTDDPFSIILKNHSARTYYLKQDLANINFPFDSAFSSTLNAVKLELTKFCEDKINITTTYTYPYKYESKSVWNKWILNSKKIMDLQDTLISNKDNIDLFNKNNLKAKKGKYDVRLNTTKLNDRVYGPNLDSVRLKYKFLTQFGISIGTFITSGSFKTVNKTYDESLYYWNLFLIYHHLGLFGGFASGGSVLPKSILDKYYEGGIYLAPGKYFYFKMGFAKYNEFYKSSITRPIIGASLIFPVLQLESGYNFAFKYPYVMVGLNLPINR